MWCNIHIKFIFHNISGCLPAPTHYDGLPLVLANKKSFHSQKHIMYTYISSFFYIQSLWWIVPVSVYVAYLALQLHLAVCWRNAPISGICPTLAYLGKILPWILWLCSSCMRHCTFVWTFMDRRLIKLFADWNGKQAVGLHCMSIIMWLPLVCIIKHGVVPLLSFIYKQQTTWLCQGGAYTIDRCISSTNTMFHERDQWCWYAICKQLVCELVGEVCSSKRSQLHLMTLC